MHLLGGNPVRDPDRYKIAGKSRYTPLRYANQTKEPPGKFVRYAWLTDDLYVYLIAFAASIQTWTDIPFYVASIFVCAVAIWTVYELGYYDNDKWGYLHEAEPKVPNNLDEYVNWRSIPKATAFSFIMSLGAASAATFYSPNSFQTNLGYLLVGLTALIATFLVFTRTPKKVRPALHLLLQLFKYLIPMSVALLSPVGACLVLSQVMFRWIPYQRYRWFNREFEHNVRFEQTVLYGIGLGFVLIFSVSDWSSIELGQAIIGAAYLAKRML